MSENPARNEILRLQAILRSPLHRAALDMLDALKRIDGINDNPACYNPMIDEVVRAAIAKAEGN